MGIQSIESNEEFVAPRRRKGRELELEPTLVPLADNYNNAVEADPPQPVVYLDITLDDEDDLDKYTVSWKNLVRSEWSSDGLVLHVIPDPNTNTLHGALRAKAQTETADQATTEKDEK